MKLEILPGTTLMVSLGVINHQGSANNNPVPWPGMKVVVILLVLGQVSARPWTQVDSVFSLGCDGGQRESRVDSHPGNMAQWPGRDGMSLASSL